MTIIVGDGPRARPMVVKDNHDRAEAAPCNLRRPIGRYLLREDELREGFRLREEIGDLMIAQIPHRNRSDFIR